MAADAVVSLLTWLSVFLLAGVIVSILSRRLGIPNVLMLLLTGILMKIILKAGNVTVDLGEQFNPSIAIIALIMIVFDSTSRLTLRKVSAETFNALNLTLLAAAMILVGLAIATRFFFGIPYAFAFLFSSIMVGTDPTAVLVMFQDLKHRAVTLLEVESIINTPLTVILPFIVLEMAGTFKIQIFFQQVIPFLQQIMTGVGTGVVIALLVFRAMKKHYQAILSPVTLISSALLTFLIAENIGGNGVLAVTTLGLFFGNIYVQRKRTLQTFGQLLSNLFEILVFMLFGFSLQFPPELSFYYRSIILFLILMALRTIAVMIIFHAKYNFKERLFLALIAPKGVAVGVVAFTLLSDPKVLTFFSKSIDPAVANQLSSNLNLVVALCLVFILYSLFFATIIAPLTAKFLEMPSKRSK